MASGLYSHPSPPLRRARIEERGHELDCSLAPRGVGLRTTLHYRKWEEFFRVAASRLYASRDIMASLLQAILRAHPRGPRQHARIAREALSLDFYPPGPDFEGPATTFKIERGAHYASGAYDSSVTNGSSMRVVLHARASRWRTRSYDTTCSNLEK